MAEELSAAQIAEARKQEVLAELRERARSLGIKGYQVMGIQKLNERVAEATDAITAKGEKEIKAEAAKAKPVVKKGEEVYPFTDPRTGKIGLFRKVDPKNELKPYSTGKKFKSGYIQVG